MREYILTEDDHRRLRWLEKGEEDQTTRNLFVKIRRSLSQLRTDLDLILDVIRELKRQRRWRGRITGSSEFGSALRCAESSLTRSINRSR